VRTSDDGAEGIRTSSYGGDASSVLGHNSADFNGVRELTMSQYDNDTSLKADRVALYIAA
jgi:hypothetical protein